VSGSICSGKNLAIIGSSGAGKTSLLNLLSKRFNFSGGDYSISGKAYLNNQIVDSKSFSLISSYVMQDDVIEENMTPIEILFFTALLKLNLPRNEIETRVKEVIKQLSLTECKDSKIGSHLSRGISGGERKRVCVAVQLITDPKIILLDEPTTGLDSFNAYNLVKILNRLSRNGKILIFTIHQPSSEILDFIDKICIMALGKTVYFGGKKNMFDFFNKINLPFPINFNPFEHLIEMSDINIIKNDKVIKNYPELSSINNDDSKFSEFVNIISDKFRDFTSHKTSEGRWRVDDIADSDLHLDQFGKNYLNQKKDVSFLFCFYILFLKQIIISKRNYKLLIIKFSLPIISTFIVIILFFGVSKNFEGIQDRLGVIIILLSGAHLNIASSGVASSKIDYLF